MEKLGSFTRYKVFGVWLTLTLTLNLGDLDFDLSRSLKFKSDDAVGLPIYGFLLMFNGNIGPNWAPLRDTRL